MEQARLIAFFSKIHIEGRRLSIDRIMLFPWENEKDYKPRFSPIDKEALERFNAIRFPDEIQNN